MTLDLTHHDGSTAGPLFPDVTPSESVATATTEEATPSPQGEGVLTRARNLALALARTLEEPFAATTTTTRHELLLAHSLASHVVDILTSLTADTSRLSRADAE